MRPFPRIPPRDDCYDFNPESPNPIRPEEGSRSKGLPFGQKGGLRARTEKKPRARLWFLRATGVEVIR